ncbi:quinoprotein dehydrogenase-associated SoxYZ-like carrier [Profundibacterium mesophilum]|uniref:Secreted protein n=1 Tax=Profundibacterium mesophilum KAUST100406-0324 TaxID=1037889 RepID=A0A921NPJ9_9RHOB|nr:quinoprotein dehydrogenase-associated SoxYZ-like carrier [Profundibacterium mesophilum]KAF0674705.1 putative secreted protein [Profundibacterium mesophilum KAUST100406-0324]
MSRLAALLALTVLTHGTLSAVSAQAAPPPSQLQPGGSWEEIAYDILGERTPQDGAGVIEMTAPYRANDAATVPIRLHRGGGDRRIVSASVVIDENPAPLAAQFEFGAAMAPLDLELRVRVDQYSNVRVIARTEGGEDFMTGRFVKASGGCSAPASRDPGTALAGLGLMKLRQFMPDGAAGEPRAAGRRAEAQIMLRHPNYSGLQRDQITQLFIPAHFIDRIEVRQGDDLLFSMTGGISISENPVFRFGYTDNGAPNFHVTAHDTEGNLFEHSFVVEAGS